MPTTSQLSAQILGQISLIQSMVLHLPDQQSVLNFVKRGLEAMPGTSSVSLRIFEQGVGKENATMTAPPPFGSFPLHFGGISYGELLFEISDPTRFSPYIPYLENLSHMLAVIFEERRQRSLNEAYKKELELRVLERTHQLEQEINKHSRSQKFLDSIINNAQNVIYVKDLEGRFTLVNQQFCKIFNLEYHQIVGRRPNDIFPHEVADEHLVNDRMVVEKHAPLSFTEHAELSDGRHEYLSIKFPILDDAGQVAAVGGISTDITELKRVENELRLDEARLEALLTLSQMNDSEIQDICDHVLDEAIRLTRSNTGYLAFVNSNETKLTMQTFISAGQETGMKIETIRDEYIVTEIGIWGDAIRRRVPIVTNDVTSLKAFANNLPKGLGTMVRHMSIPVFDGNRIVAVAGVGNKPNNYDVSDVRQLKLIMQGMWRLIQRLKAEKEKHELERRLRQAYKMESIGTLAGGIAHDFNNILSAIFGYTELCLSEVKPGTLVHSSMKNVFNAAIRARDLVAHILTFSRQKEHEIIPVQLTPIIKEVNKFIRASLPTTIEIRQSIKGTPTVMADPTQIHQVVMNLCTNARHAMAAKGGLLDLGIEPIEVDEEFAVRHPGLKPGAHVKLSVSDTGHGISPAIIDRIFDPFFTTKERGQGTGMGLAVAHGIVKRHGGVITVYSSLGKGTVFNVFLPAIEKRSFQHTKASSPPIGGTERILLVDDEKPLVDLGVRMLTALGYQVTGETSSLDALRRFSEAPERFDLIITDLTMPKMTGDSLARKLIRIRPDIPIILCTGFSASVNEETALSMGIRAFIKKPILIQQISEIIRKVLD